MSDSQSSLGNASNTNMTNTQHKRKLETDENTEKRGLPHAHILATFIPEDKPMDVEAIDKIVSATIPDRNTEPRLFDIVTQHYVHRVCGDANPVDGKCSKFFPKSFSEVTSIDRRVDGRGRILYKRPNDGRSFFYNDFLIDNRRIVPYNRFAAANYDCHINFEICTNMGPVKYLYKYIYKGGDCITLQTKNDTNVMDWDEIQSFIDCRYVSSPEAAWKLLDFPLNERSHSVLMLPVHFPDEQPVYFDESNLEEAVERAGRRSKLMAWFELNRSSAISRNYKYFEIPEHYVWNDRQQCWNARRQISKQIGCIQDVSPLDCEKLRKNKILH